MNTKNSAKSGSLLEGGYHVPEWQVGMAKQGQLMGKNQPYSVYTFNLNFLRKITAKAGGLPCPGMGGYHKTEQGVTMLRNLQLYRVSK